MPAMTPAQLNHRHPHYRPDTPMALMLIYDRMRRWVAATDQRIVRQFWPMYPDGTRRPWCPVCGRSMLAGMPSQTAIHLPEGRARQALAVGGLTALTSDMPIEPGELWYIVCLACLGDRQRTHDDSWLPNRLHQLVEEALRSDRVSGPAPSSTRTKGG